MNFLVTGASGFVGRSLCTRLLVDGHAVRGTLLASETAAMLVQGVEPTTIEPLGPDTAWWHALNDVDTIIHLAARVHVMDERTADPLASFRLVNVEGTARLAREAAKAGVKRLVFVSSVKVHGEEAPTPYDENSSCNPQDPYGVSKMEAEQALRRIEAETGLEVVIVRPPLVYGPGVKANFLRMVQVIARGLPLPLASIANRRSLLYVGNLANALATCVIHPKAAGQTYLVSDGKAVSTPELIRSVAAVMGVPARLFPMPVAVMQLAGILTGKKTAVQRLAGSLAVDSSKIRQELGWVPPFTMEEGLKETAEWFKKHQS
jgi:nucleoside-diphosphate-sugar epimerase